MIPALGHAWDNGVITKEPTETETGIKTFTCGNCADTKTETLPVLDHTHKYTAVVTAPTCTENGYTTYTCPCGDSYVGDQTSAKGHTETVINGKDATCTESGLTEGKKCSVCGEILLEQSVIPALGHAWDNGIITKEPTETETGIKTFTCSNCGETKTESIPVLAHTHNYEAIVTAPTCIEKGYTTHTCSCGDSYTDSYVNTTDHIMGKWEQIKAPTCTENGEETRKCTTCNHVETREIHKTAHQYESTVTAPTCTEIGYTTFVCSCGNTFTEDEIPALGHTLKTGTGKDSTCLKTGLTGTVTCSVCQIIVEEASVIPKKDHQFNHLGCTVCGVTFADNDGYHCLATFHNGVAMQAFYQELDRLATEFHTSGKDLMVSETVAMVGYISQADFGLTIDEAALAFSFYKDDHPNYFWIYPGYATTNTGNFALITAAEYASAANRAQHEQKIFDTLNEYLELVKDEDSIYEMALAFHDKIITDTFYTTDPEDMNSVWAHNILGVLENGNGVCESYAKTFQLLLNCVGIENIFVTGSASGINHVWNMIRLEDGKWYWCDLTWDDDENNSMGLGWGISYNYFCITDMQNTLHYYQDGGYLVDSNGDGKHDFSNIHETHILEFSHHLPQRSNTVFDGSLRDTFTVDGLEFAISGYRTVQFVFTEKSGVVNIPETVEYNGVTYTVISVGRINEEGLYSRGQVAPNASRVNLPNDSVYVWETAM